MGFNAVYDESDFEVVDLFDDKLDDMVDNEVVMMCMMRWLMRCI